jgi:chorismate mutase
MFVAESKFISSPSSFLPHILTPNGPALLALITKPAVEAALLVRLANKARLYGQDLDAMGNPIHPEGEGGDESGRGKIEAEEVVKLYERYIIPLTKEVEVSPSQV